MLTENIANIETLKKAITLCRSGHNENLAKEMRHEAHIDAVDTTRDDFIGQIINKINDIIDEMEYTNERAAYVLYAKLMRTLPPSSHPVVDLSDYDDSEVAERHLYDQMLLNCLKSGRMLTSEVIILQSYRHFTDTYAQFCESQLCEDDGRNDDEDTEAATESTKKARTI